MKKILLIVLMLSFTQNAYSETLDTRQEDNVIKTKTTMINNQVNTYPKNINNNQILSSYSFDFNNYLGNHFSWGWGLGVQPTRIIRALIYFPYLNANAKYYFISPAKLSVYTKTQFTLGYNSSIGQSLGIEKRFSDGLTLDGNVGINFLVFSNFDMSPSINLGMGYSYNPKKLNPFKAKKQA